MVEEPYLGRRETSLFS